MASRFRPLLPAQSPRQSNDPEVPEAEQERRPVLVACSACQKAKTKCSGDRPVCYRCGTRNIPCEYDAEPNQTRASSRRAAGEQLRELFNYLQTRSWNEAVGILRRIRESTDPLEVVRLIKDGDLLLLHAGPEEKQMASAEPQSPSQHPSRLIPITTSPWTTVTDSSTLKRLISIFFEKDQRFLMSFIDRDMFLKDMQASPQPSQNGWFCSVLLVNAICAFTVRYYATTFATNPTDKGNLGEAFFSESKRLLDLEAGKPSLPTAQALLIMFSYCCIMGRDRAGSLFRAAGYEMMKRVMPRVNAALSNNTHAPEKRRAILKALWGMFCFDSVCSSVYLRPSLFSTPEIPHLYELVDKMEHSQSESGEGGSAKVRIGFERDDMTLKYACDLSEIFNKAMLRPHLHGPGASSSQLAQLYDELQILESRLPMEQGYKETHHYEHRHLWAYHHVVAANIARLVQNYDAQILSEENAPTDNFVGHCQSIIRNIDRHLYRHPSERDGSLTILYFAYTCTSALLDYVNTSASASQTFTRACQIIHEANVYPLSNLLLEGLAAVAHQLSVQLPDDTAPYFSNINTDELEQGDIALGFAVPISYQLSKLLSDEESDLDPECFGIELGDVIARSRANRRE